MAECTGDICRSNRTKRIVWDRLASVAGGFPQKSGTNRWNPTAYAASLPSTLTIVEGVFRENFIAARIVLDRGFEGRFMK